ncbi:hypothetical protein M404DRAFT_991328 [Pisolithus tinctorius Marx 270]|uniref:Uncharacterized protein n=1 Tax=Pisolithus tinctorius Marx 270 TaxID=870435 RepID=A0A0C3JZH8_PISTI|nr:hypothetical protein M404DRAFT_991328 [Pisolithus tinctorius Marx 270]
MYHPYHPIYPYERLERLDRFLSIAWIDVSHSYLKVASRCTALPKTQMDPLALYMDRVDPFCMANGHLCIYPDDSELSC